VADVAAGILTAVILTIAWITTHLVWMHVRPARNRLRAMTLTYLAALPFTVPLLGQIASKWLPAGHGENAGVGLIHAFLLGLLLYLLFVECFYHVERSVTLRLLVEIMQRQEHGPVTLRDVQADYTIDDMVARRLALLRDRGFVESTHEGWTLVAKGLVLTQIMRMSCWLFQSKTQDERL
jgi:hypothetical protein